MDKTDRIYQPRTGSHAEHVFAALIGEPVEFASSLTGDPAHDLKLMYNPPKRCAELKAMARGICQLAGLDPDAQPDELLEGAWENDEGLACLEQNSGDGFTYVMYALYGATHRQDKRNWTDIRLPMWQVVRHWLDVTGDEE